MAGSLGHDRRSFTRLVDAGGARRNVSSRPETLSIDDRDRTALACTEMNRDQPINRHARRGLERRRIGRQWRLGIGDGLEDVETRREQGAISRGGPPATPSRRMLSWRERHAIEQENCSTTAPPRTQSVLSETCNPFVARSRCCSPPRRSQHRASRERSRSCSPLPPRYRAAPPPNRTASLRSSPGRSAAWSSSARTTTKGHRLTNPQLGCFTAHLLDRGVDGDVARLCACCSLELARRDVMAFWIRADSNEGIRLRRSVR